MSCQEEYISRIKHELLGFLPRIKYAVLLNPSYLFAQIIVLKNIQPL